MFVPPITPVTTGSFSPPVVDGDARITLEDRPHIDRSQTDQGESMQATENYGCDYCGSSSCQGDCDGYYDALLDDRDARYEAWRDRKVD